MSHEGTKSAIRVATSASDFQQLDALIAEYEEYLPADLRHSDADLVRSRLPERYRGRNAALLAFDGDRACACVLLNELDSTLAVVTKMYVQTSQRGRGLARALMNALTDRAKALGYHRIVLDTDAEQLRPAYELYKSLGFVDCEPYGSVEYANPTYMEYVI
jgi:GNAT superfamily N-acetyltransferase